MNLLEVIIYGLLSGISEIIPVSSRGHQVIMLQIFGASERIPVLDLFIHLGVLFAVLTSCRTLLSRLRRESSSGNRAMRAAMPDQRGVYELRLIRVAAAPMLAGLLFYRSCTFLEKETLWCALFFVVNGLILFITEHLRQANKDARKMSAFDSCMIGLLSATSVLPGISRIGSGTSAAVACGSTRQNALNWSLILSIPALVLLLLFDILNVVSTGFANLSIILVLGYVLAAVCAYLGACASIFLMRFLTVRSGLSGFAYYSWGAAMLMFILNLIA